MKRLIFFALSLALALIYGCKGDKIQNQWADRQINIDGDYSDWNGISPNLLENRNIVMGLANDENNLYLMFRGNDQGMARRMQGLGVTVWLNAEGKKKKDYGICYTGSLNLPAGNRPKPDASDTGSQQLEDRMQQMREKLRKELPRPGMIMTIQNGEREEIGASNPHGPSAGSAYQNDVFCYEFKIPLPLSTAMGDEIKLGLEWGSPAAGDRDEMRREMGGMHGGGRMGGRPGSMGRPDGMRGGEHPPGGSGFEEQEQWFKVILAKEK